MKPLPFRRLRLWLPIVLLAVPMLPLAVQGGRPPEPLPLVLLPTSETYRFPRLPGEGETAAPYYLHQLLPVLKQAIRARLTVTGRLQAAAGDARRLNAVLQEYAGVQMNLLRQISRLQPPPPAARLQPEVVQALYFQMQFFRHYATWLLEEPRHTLRDEISDSRLQGCQLALQRAASVVEQAFPRLGYEEKRVLRAHWRALELL